MYSAFSQQIVGKKRQLNINLYFLDDVPTRGLPYMMCVADFSLKEHFEHTMQIE